MACRANAMAMGALAALMERVRNDSAAKPDTVAPAVLDGVKNVLNALEGIDRRLARLEKSAKARGRLDAEADEAEQYRLRPVPEIERTRASPTRLRLSNSSVGDRWGKLMKAAHQPRFDPQGGDAAVGTRQCAVLGER